MSDDINKILTDIQCFAKGYDFQSFMREFFYKSKVEHNAEKFDEKYIAQTLIIGMFLVCKYTNGENHKKINEEQFTEYLILVDTYISKLLVNLITKYDTKDDFSKVISILFRTQQWAAQKRTCIKDSFRMFYITTQLHEFINISNQLDFEKSIYDTYQTDVSSLLIISLFLFMIGDSNTCYMTSIEIKRSYHGYGETISKIIHSKSIDANNIKALNKIKSWHQLRLKPFFKINNIYAISNIPCLYDLSANLIYWTSRNYYNKPIFPTDLFPEKFGYYFEEYVHQLLNFYFGASVYKYPSNGVLKTVPDFKITLDDYVIFIEVKSYISKIKTWDLLDVENMDELELFIKKVNSKSIRQLRSQKYDGPKKRINLTICQETMDNAPMYETIIKNDGKTPIFYVNISELEDMVQLYKNSKKRFARLINQKEKNYLSENNCQNCCMQILINKIMKNKVLKNEFLISKRKDLTNDLVHTFKDKTKINDEGILRSIISKIV